jgi:hypothetical protein
MQQFGAHTINVSILAVRGYVCNGFVRNDQGCATSEWGLGANANTADAVFFVLGVL